MDAFNALMRCDRKLEEHIVDTEVDDLVCSLDNYTGGQLPTIEELTMCGGTE